MTILSAQTIQSRIETSTDYHWRMLRGSNLDTPEVQRLRQANDLVVRPFELQQKKFMGMSYGLSSCGYDIRLGKIRKPFTQHDRASQPWMEDLKQTTSMLHMQPGQFVLAASLEYMAIPNDLCARVLDKSTLARQGLALQNTILEPGWDGYITLELSNHSDRTISIRSGQPIAQVVFEKLDQPTDRPYRGKYQSQSSEPTDAIFEASEGGDTTDEFQLHDPSA